MSFEYNFHLDKPLSISKDHTILRRDCDNLKAYLTKIGKYKDGKILVNPLTSSLYLTLSHELIAGEIFDAEDVLNEPEFADGGLLYGYSKRTDK